MNPKKILKYDTEDFILDDDFRKWVLHPDKENDQLWTDFLEKHPEKGEQIKDAVLVLKSLQPVEPDVPLHILDQILNRIKPAPTPFRKVRISILKYAAIFILLLSVGGLIFYSLKDKDNYHFELAGNENFEKGKLILADGTVREFETEQTKILQSSSGKITVNSDTITQDVRNLKTEENAMNMIVIPYGKRSEITLADGTHIWLNSGSQLSYPAVFSGNAREVYLSGEAFFDVETDHSRPFYVVTKDIKLKVTGTSFNVSSYENDLITHAVLKQGSVSVGKNMKFSKTIDLKPGERILYDKLEKSLIKSQVNVDIYASWINGYLILESEPLAEIFKKLERYYNKTIIVEDSPDIFTFSGKLDLLENIEEVLKNISYSTSFSVKMKDDRYIIKFITPM